MTQKSFKTFTDLALSPIAATVAIAVLLNGLANTSHVILAVAACTLSLLWSIYVWSKRENYSLAQKRKPYTYSASVRWLAILGSAVCIPSLVFVALVRPAPIELVVRLCNDGDSAVSYKKSAYFELIDRLSNRTENTLSGSVVLARMDGASDDLTLEAASSMLVKVRLETSDRVVSVLESEASEIQLSLSNDRGGTYKSNLISFDRDALQRTQVEPLELNPIDVPIELKHLELEMLYGGDPKLGSGMVQLVRQNRLIESQQDSISSKDVIKLTGRFNRAVEWKLLWIFPDSDVELAANSDGAQELIAFPAFDDEYDYRLGLGVHTIVLLAANDSWPHEFDDERLVAMIKELGPPPSVVPNGNRGLVRSFVRSRKSENTRTVLPSGYAEQLNSVLPQQFRLYMCFLNVQGH